ncbi:PREDICTED: cytokinin dehydrogenase 3-like isoform X1 [Camelina sativa]|uniref:cytokinin dehydrogenase n=1 Tax=Camelina sativa TaxID=90675 RepID=A0ABM0V6J5_CAMSA|nr:PREDICTED: cytokinin dehydrogenase 3-like isoform X1 [Camelina sativa]
MASNSFRSQIHLGVIIILIIITLLTPITTYNTSPQPWNILSHDDFAGKLTTASSSIESAATDFGHVTKIFPSAVLNPSSVEDITDLLKLSYDSQPSFTLAARGHGHSHRGQASAKDGVVVNMRSMVNRDRGIKVSRTGLYADVDAAWLWIEVLNKTLELGLTPVSWTDYLYLTVGGTLSNAGISGQTFRYGPQITNVQEMDVITGKGEIATCSKYMNSDLFFAALGGLGQFGIITRARIKLEVAPKRAKWFRFLYIDFSEFTRDQERLISETDGLDFLEGSVMLDRGPPDNWRSTYYPPSDHLRIVSMVKRRRVIYCLEVVKYYDETSQYTVNEEMEELGESLNFVKGFMYEKDVTYMDFLNRVRTGELSLKSKGQWDVPHPWLNLFVPKSQISKFDHGVFKGIILRNNITSGPVLVYPMNRNKWNDRMSAAIPEEDVFYAVGFLRSADFDDWEAYDRENMEILKFCEDANMRVIQYLPYHSSQEGWVRHFGPRWNIFLERKYKYDPKMILSPGQNIFQ